jgi:hypothetical protein
MVTLRVDVLLRAVVPRVFGRKNNLVPVASFLHPLAHPFLRVSIVVQIGNIDEVSAIVVEGVEESETLLFRDLTGAVCR